MNKQSKKQFPECQCGCGKHTKGGRFAPGHDAKLKKSLIDATLGGSKRAENNLNELGWTKFLDAKRNSLASEKVPGKSKVAKRCKPSEPASSVTAKRRRGRPSKRPDATDAVLLQTLAKRNVLEVSYAEAKVREEAAKGASGKAEA